MESLGAVVCLFPEDQFNDTIKGIKMQEELLPGLKESGI
jgi:hypothetical protein